VSLPQIITGLQKRIEHVRSLVPSFAYGEVASVTPPTVILDSDATSTPRPIADSLVTGLTVGQRVEVRAIGSRRDIVAQAGGGDTGWLAVTAGATFAGSSLYVRKVGDFVTLRGQGTRTTGNVTSGDVVCTLDAAYRPATSRSFTGNGSGSALAKMVIASSGIITVSSAPSATTTYIRLDSGNYSID